MDFPIVDLLDEDLSKAWLLKYFHPEGLKCPHCGKGVEEAREFRKTKKSQLLVWRCNACQGIYNLYSGTVFEGKHLRPMQVVVLVRGVCKGEPAATLAREMGVSRQTVHAIRKVLQANAERDQPQTPLTDARAETDEMFQNAGEKR
jgi:transposase-like protein